VKGGAFLNSHLLTLPVSVAGLGLCFEGRPLVRGLVVLMMSNHRVVPDFDSSL
jgi:hypothetical protein